MFGDISEKFRTFDMQINFAIPPISHFRRWLGEFFSLFQSYEISITLSINSLRNYWAFHDSPYSISSPILHGSPIILGNDIPVDSKLFQKKDYYNSEL